MPPSVSDPGLPLDGPTILGLVEEVDGELADDASTRLLVVVGGALLAWHGLRATTTDVDSIVRLDRALMEAVERVAKRRGLAPRWLNDSAAPFAPAGFDDDRTELLWSGRRLEVRGAPMDQVFLMKLAAGRAVDTSDLQILWPRSGFASTNSLSTRSGRRIHTRSSTRTSSTGSNPSSDTPDRRRRG